MRELLLLERNEWQFLITTWPALDYLEDAVALHYENFNRLYNIANTYTSGHNADEREWHFLGAIEASEGLFEAIDLKPFTRIRSKFLSCF